MLYFSSLISTYGASAENLFSALDRENITYTLLEGTRDIWVRDFMPVKTKSGKYISFRYEPSYLKYDPQIRTDFLGDIESHLDLPVVKSYINLDGGNVVLSPSKEKAIVSDRVFKENKMPKKVLLRELEALLEAQITVIPSLPQRYDMTGHADGMVRFADENTVLANVPDSLHGHEAKVKSAIEGAGLTAVDFPFFCEKSDKLSAKGCYINFLETENVIFLPVFGVDADEKVLAVARLVTGKRVVPVNINEIALQGGLLNCISWEN